MNDFLHHILDECSYLSQLLEGGLTYGELINDETLKRAVVRSLEVIGEATKQVKPEIKRKHQHIEWKEMSGMRDRLIHNYMGVNFLIVWDVLENKIPALHKKMSEILRSE